MIHTFSKLADHRDCPRYYKAKHIDKEVKWSSTPAQARGKRLHKEIRNSIELAHPLPSEFKGPARLIELLSRHEARTEIRVAVTEDWRGCHYYDDRVKLRGDLDVYLGLPKRKSAILVDWKTGNPNFTDRFQAKVYAAMVGGATTIGKVLFIWGYFSGEMPWEVVDTQAARLAVNRAMDAVDNDKEFPPRPCWKCKFCEVKWCEHNENRELIDDQNNDM